MKKLSQSYTDSDRLEFLLKYFSIDDVGDEECVLGVCVSNESLEFDLSYGEYDPTLPSNPSLIKDGDNILDVIDRAIDAHKPNFIFGRENGKG